MKDYLRKNWKPLTFWSGVGGLLFGGAVLAYRKGCQATSSPAVPIPEEFGRIRLRMTPSEFKYGEDFPAVCNAYELAPTAFRIWNVVERRSAGHRVFYVTSRRLVQASDGREKAIPGEPFYAVVGIHRFTKKADLPDHLRKGSPVVFHLCLVGGGDNGIPTGEKIVTQGCLDSWEVLDEGHAGSGPDKQGGKDEPR